MGGIIYIQPGKPVQNAYVERFNRLYREDVLDAYMFDNIRQVRVLSEKWMEDYNQLHPHKSLGGKSPNEFLKIFTGAGTRSCEKQLSLPTKMSTFKLS